jgi:competence ComEA-like helix-hairpin-helix protein
VNVNVHVHGLSLTALLITANPARTPPNPDFQENTQRFLHFAENRNEGDELPSSTNKANDSFRDKWRKTMRIDTLMISLFLLTLGAVGCSQPEAVNAEYEPANCNCVEQTGPSEAPPAHTNGLADGLADEPAEEPTTFAQAGAPTFAQPAEVAPDETTPDHDGALSDEPGRPVQADGQAQPAAKSDDPPKKAEKQEGDPNGVVNLNTASAKQLMALPGVGPALAERIVEYRQQRRFEETKHLLRVRGIGKATFAKLAPMLAVSGATTLAK